MGWEGKITGRLPPGSGRGCAGRPLGPGTVLGRLATCCYDPETRHGAGGAGPEPLVQNRWDQSRWDRRLVPRLVPRRLVPLVIVTRATGQSVVRSGG